MYVISLRANEFQFNNLGHKLICTLFQTFEKLSGDKCWGRAKYNKKDLIN